MKVGDMVIVGAPNDGWNKVGLVLGFRRVFVLVYWGTEDPYEEEYFEDLEVLSESR